jgi:orotidine-5'-phosphate decarboxylase
VLTSHSKSDLVDMGINQPPSELALNLAKKCKEAGFDGVVCSVHEVEKIKSEIGTDFITVTPGIRLTDTEQRDDQKRVATPKQAIDAGADYLVVGRSFLTSKDPVGILQKTIEELG